jgi:hypothetical protein
MVPSSIGLGPVPDPENLDCVAEFVESDTVIANTQAEFRRINVLKPLDICLAGLNVSRQSVKDIHCGALIDGRKVSRSSPGDLFGHRLPVRAVLF